MKKNIVIGATSLISEKKAGVSRVVEEIILALDENMEWREKYNIYVVSPFDINIRLNNVIQETYNPIKIKNSKIGIEIWNQIFLVQYVKKKRAILIDISMECPFLHNDITYIHDCQPEHYRDNYITGKYSKWVNKIKLLKRNISARKTKKIVTVSSYVKGDIIRTFNVAPEKVEVIYNGWQHIRRVQEDETVFNRYKFIEKNNYFFSLGSGYKHKNIKWVFEAAKQNPNYKFVVTGDYNAAAYSEDIEKKAPENVFFTGYLSDAEVKALMMYCIAFVQPSFSEGFGIPPLEAMSLGCKLIVSNSTCFPEIYGNAACYINPFKYDDINMKNILKQRVSDGNIILSRYSWKQSAEQLITVVGRL